MVAIGSRQAMATLAAENPSMMATPAEMQHTPMPLMIPLAAAAVVVAAVAAAEVVVVVVLPP